VLKTEVVPTLTEPQVAAVRALAGAAAEADGIGPLSEQILLRLRTGPASAGSDLVLHLLAELDGEIAGYGQLDGADRVAEVVVLPRLRRRGAGRALLDAALVEATGETAGQTDGTLQVWAHGAGAPAAALARSLHFERSRILYRMGRSTREPLPPLEVPDGVRLTKFTPGVDDERWLAVNARAFAHHPEQGKWTKSDLALRMAEPWFDAAGFFLAERVTDGALLGFHWTKVVDEVGEVYVVGVDPDAQGVRLGRALTLAGLHHLVDAGHPEIILYVDESNPRAVALYEGLGFEVQVADILYARQLD
jgi:mycothiol synthase